MDILLNIVIGVVGIAIGFAIAKQLERKRASQTIKNAKKTAANILKEAKSEGESIKKDKILQAKEKFIELKSEHEKVIMNRDKKMNDAEKRIRDKESQVSGELSKNKKLNKEFDEKLADYNHRIEYLEKLVSTRGGANKELLDDNKNLEEENKRLRNQIAKLEEELEQYKKGQDVGVKERGRCRLTSDNTLTNISNNVEVGAFISIVKVQDSFEISVADNFIFKKLIFVHLRKSFKTFKKCIFFVAIK